MVQHTCVSKVERSRDERINEGGRGRPGLKGTEGGHAEGRKVQLHTLYLRATWQSAQRVYS